MRYQFYRFYLLLILLASIIILSFNQIVKTLDDSSEHYSINIDYLFSAFEHQTNKLGESKLGLPQFEYLNAGDLALPESLQSSLSQGQAIALLNDDKQTYYYRRAIHSDQVIRLGPVAVEREKNSYFIYLVMVFYACLAMLLLAMMRPLFRDLQRLQNDADNFGRQPVTMQSQIKPSSSIYPLAKAFNRMSSKIVGLIDMNKDLSRAISHEIRTPLARMKFMLAIISDKLDGQQQQQISSDIHEIEFLVNDYLSFAKVEGHTEKDNFKLYSPRSFLKLIQQKFAIYADDIDFQMNAGVEKARFDKDSLALATQNLLTNALRYADSQIRVSFYVKDRRCYLQVEDDGPGIAEQSDSLQQAFKRDSSDDDAHQGFGLGLYIVKNISLLYEGEFTIARSSELGGASMLLSWPNER
ncbi:ATP-binding protein [Thalassotalea ponticola]|uniref:ATP-binding protein n=1 Tax=Thalassotalea ponticola TaxID=1523392 RepID=UPI0025B57A03|nr:ATP-binding protein [Thalassotalea ponticola]MDN3651829.1 ATP-binding protein [Thalassotalea ponticola]